MPFRHTLDAQAVKDAMQGRWHDFYEQYRPLKRVGAELRGPCPLHGGTRPNFAVNPDTGDWYCHSRCQQGGDALALLMRLENLTFPEALRRLADYAGLYTISPDPPTRPRKGSPNGTMTLTLPRRGPIVAVYDYTDEAGTLLFQATRHQPKAFRQRRPDPDAPGAWLPNLNGVELVLYRLPQVAAAVRRKETIYVTEGERDADALVALGLCATTNPMGAGKWRDAFTQALCHADVVILPDNDPPGRAHAAQVANTLHGQAARVRVVDLPDLPPKGDISDWLAAGGTRQALEALVSQDPEFVPRSLPEAGKDQSWSGPPPRKPVADRVIRARDVGPPPDNLPYLFGPYLNLGATHWMTGQTGIGKSTFVYNLAGALAEAAELWGIQSRKQRVLYLDMESGDLGRQLKMGRLYPQAEPPEDWLFATEPIRLPEELAEFLAYVQAEGVTFVVFDTARRCFQVKDENDNAEVYNRIVPTLDTLKHQGVASLVLGHPAKNGNGSARGAGAQEDAGDVNLSLTMHRGEVTDADGIIKLTITKNRLLGLGHPPLYLRRAGGDRFERVEAQEANRPDPEAEEPAGRQEQCRDAILSLLHRQPNNHATHGEIITAMKRQGYSVSTAKRAHTALVADGALVRALASRFPQGGYCLPDPFADGDESDEMA